jgi:hypothetical protein
MIIVFASDMSIENSTSEFWQIQSHSYGFQEVPSTALVLYIIMISFNIMFWKGSFVNITIVV